MVIDIAIVIMALACAVLVGFLVPVLIQIKKTAAESQKLISNLDREVPALVHEVRSVTEHVGAISGQARDSVEHASALLHAVGEVGDSVQQVHNVVKGRSGSLLINLAGVLAGVKAASTVVKERVHHIKEGGESNGKR
jgi:uncharacterized protein YoxC